MAETMVKMIHNALAHIQQTQNVNILYAAESGSRAWGFASENSDYDVRFIYAHPLTHYLSFNVELKRNVIEEDVKETDLDIRGWDIKKAMHLFTRSNGALLEWLRSPVSYIDPHPSIEKLTDLASRAFDPTALMFHYFRMGKNNAREFLRGDTVSLKKYLYVLRCFLAVDFIRVELKLPPVNFRQLLSERAKKNPNVEAMQETVLDLIQKKQESQELGTGARIPDLDTYIADALAFNEKQFVDFRKDDLRQHKWDAKLNNIFWLAIGHGI